jgi:hypothetical protein
LPVASGLLLCGLIGWLVRDRFLAGTNDFAQLYAGARLAGTPELYTKAGALRIHREAFAAELESVYYSRPPFYALLLRPLASLPYRAAFALFVGLNLLAILWFFHAFGRGRPEVPVFGALYPPTVVSLLTGQDVGLVLALAAAGYLLLDRGRGFAAGLVWSLCSVKAHLFLLLPLVLACSRQWRALAGGAAGGALLAGLSFAAQGPGWVGEYLAMLSDPEIHPGLDHMPNLQAVRLAAAPQAGDGFLWAGGILVAALAARIALRSSTWQAAFPYALAGSLAISYHAYMQDCLPLLLAFAVALEHVRHKRLRILWALALAPLTPLALAAGSPWSAIPALLYVTLAAAAALAPGAPARTADASPLRPPDPAAP